MGVVWRAHHHVLYARVPKFKPSMTNRMLCDGDIFEYWTHAAAFLPISDFRFSLPYKHAIKSGQTHWYRTRDKKLMGELLARIRSDGPIRSRDVETNATKRAGWWDWKPAKQALEQMYMEGDLMVSDREGCQKTYDLTERVLPSHVNSKMPSMEEFAAHVVDQQLRCHGFASLKGLTYQRRNTELRKAVKALVNERLAQRALEEVQVSNGDVFIVEAGALECYVPAAKRQYGYFCLPLLYRNDFIGRMDCKAHRKSRHLEIKTLHLEQHDFEEDLVISAFADAITQFCHFQNCDSVSLAKVEPSHLTQRLRCALNF